MTWTPFRVYLTVLSSTTGMVILLGTFTVQCASDWGRMRHRPAYSTAPHSQPGPSILPSAGEVKPSLTPRKDAGQAHPLVTRVGAIPGAHNLSFFALDGRRERVDVRRLAHAAADLCGVERELAWSLALRESSGRHWGEDGRVLKSSSSAWGLYQIKKATARDVDPKLDIMRPFDNALAGLCHFRGLLDKAKGRGGVRLALRWYHRGEYARGPVPQATHDYVEDIMEGSDAND